jgi:GT2 family glycosyltransferase
MTQSVDHLITVIIPHFSDLGRLCLCLDALERQTVKRELYRVIVADNFSPQGPEAVRDIVAGRAEVIFVSERGAGLARNAAAALACTQFLAFTDCDCLPHANWLEQCLLALHDCNDEFHFFGGAIAVSTPDASRLSRAEALEVALAFDNRTYVKTKKFSVTANLMTPLDVFRLVGGFGSGVSEDVDWCHRARRKGFIIGYAPRAIVSHPARQTWAELKEKCARIQRETAAMMTNSLVGRLCWMALTCLLPASIVVHTIRICFADRPDGTLNKLKAVSMLIQLRSWRFMNGMRLAFVAREALLAKPVPKS